MRNRRRAGNARFARQIGRGAVSSMKTSLSGRDRAVPEPFEAFLQHVWALLLRGVRGLFLNVTP